MYKLVSALYEDEIEFVTGEKNISKGFYFYDDNEILTNADKKIFEEFIFQLEDDDCKYGTFEHYLDYLNIDYLVLPSEEYVSEDAINEWIKDYKYYYSKSNNSFHDSDCCLGDCVEYYEFYNGHNWKQIELECLDELALVDCNIDYSLKNYEQCDLYKSLYNNTLYLYYSSNFIGDLGYVEEITKEDLKERFNYKLPDCM